MLQDRLSKFFISIFVLIHSLEEIDMRFTSTTTSSSSSYFIVSIYFSLLPSSSLYRCVCTVKAMIIKLFKIALLSFFTCSLLMISIILNVYNPHYNIINDELLSFDNDERRDLFAFINQESHERKAL